MSSVTGIIRTSLARPPSVEQLPAAAAADIEISPIPTHSATAAACVVCGLMHPAAPSSCAEPQAAYQGMGINPLASGNCYNLYATCST